MSQFESCVGAVADNACLQQLFSVPQPSSGVQIAFERAPDYFASANVMYQYPKLLLVRRKASQELAAAVNMGQRVAYINGRKTLMFYGADMRIAPPFRGGRALLYTNRAVRKTVGEGWYLTVILQDNQRSKSSLEGARAGLPRYAPIGKMTTYTVTAARQHLSEAGALTVRTATQTDIPAMNAWVHRMREHYQFLPCYNFYDLQDGNAFYAGLSFSDFLLLERDGKLAGLVGLWDQHALKQARVVGYSPIMKMIRPVYNVWSRLSGGLLLPPIGSTFGYLSLHSPLTTPDDLAGFAKLLRAAMQHTRARGFCGMALTLSEQDPRRQAMADFKYVALEATQYSVAYTDDNQPDLSSQFIPFHDVGRL